MIMTSSAVQVSVRTILATCKRSVKVVLHILRSILLPVHLLQQLLMPGLRLQEEGVRHRSIELLDNLLAHADQFITHVVDSDVIGNSSSLRAALLKEMRFLLRSERLPGLPLLLSLWRTEIAAAKQRPARPHFAAHLLRILRVLSSVQLIPARFAAELNVAALMADIESLAGSGVEKEAVEALQLEALLLLTDLVKKAEEDHHHKEAEDEEESATSKVLPMAASSFFLLQDSLTEETFAILLANILDGGAAVRKQEDTTATIEGGAAVWKEDETTSGDGGAAVRMEDDTTTGDGGAAVGKVDDSKTGDGGAAVRKEDDSTTGDGGAAVRKREASREILRVVMRQSGAGLQEGTDLQLVLDLCPALHSPQLRAQIARAMLR
jgi:hypothetical protein